MRPTRRRLTRTWTHPPGHSSCQIVVMSSDGSNPVVITRDIFCARSPAWSPDGSIIAYNGQDEATGRLGIILANPDGTGHAFVRPVLADFSRVAWAPVPLSNP